MISPPAAKMRGSFSDTEGAKLEFWNFQDAEIVGDGTNNDSSLTFTATSTHLADETSQRKWWTIDARHKESLQDNLVELSISTSGQESVSLDQETEIDIIRDWSISVWSLLVVTLVVTDIDTHGGRVFRSLRSVRQSKSDSKMG